MKRTECIALCGVLSCILFGCGQAEQQVLTEDVVEFEQITPLESEPIIIREEQPQVVESKSKSFTRTRRCFIYNQRGICYQFFLRRIHLL